MCYFNVGANIDKIFERYSKNLRKSLLWVKFFKYWLIFAPFGDSAPDFILSDDSCHSLIQLNIFGCEYNTFS